VRRTKRTTPPEVNPAASRVRNRLVSGFDGIGPLAILTFRGGDGQAQLLANRTGQESADRMRLPASGFHQLWAVTPPGCFGSSRTLAVLLPARAESPLFSRSGVLGAFLTRLVFLPALPFFGATWARRAPGRAFFPRFGLRSCAGRGGFGLFCDCRHIISLCGAHRDHMDHSGAPGKQVNSARLGEGRCKGDARTPLAPELRHIYAGVLR